MTNSRKATFVLAVLAAACVSQPEGQSQHSKTGVEAVLDTAGCAEMGWRTCIRERESAVMRVVAGVHRAGDTLVIEVPGHATVKLGSTPDTVEVGYEYVYHGYVPALHSHLVEVLLYEGGYFVLVLAETGRRFSIDAQPVIAPSGLRFVTTSWDTEAGYVDNRVQIYRLAGDSVVLEWQAEPTTWGPTDASWLDDSTLTFRRQPALGTDSLRLRGSTTVRLRAGRWAPDNIPE